MDMKDVRLDFYRAQGAGGQHVNKTDSACRATHIPTGIVAQNQDSRDQHSNKAKAIETLRERVYAKFAEEFIAIVSDWRGDTTDALFETLSYTHIFQRCFEKGFYTSRNCYERPLQPDGALIAPFEFETGVINGRGERY